jgi:hypothetical protein
LSGASAKAYGVSRTAIRTIVGVVVAAVATMALSITANWRLALLAGVVTAAIAATRMRYARQVALALRRSYSGWPARRPERRIG